ncbi:MAG: hypothetical protein ACI4PO_08630 [Faecousia sp.]
MSQGKLDNSRYPVVKYLYISAMNGKSSETNLAESLGRGLKARVVDGS